MKVGELQIDPVYDGTLTVMLPEGFPTPDEPEFGPHRDVVTADGRWAMPIGAFLVRSGDRLVLVDTGAGPGPDVPFRPPQLRSLDEVEGPDGEALRSMGQELGAERILELVNKTEIVRGRLPTSLSALGVSVGDVTDVVLTHLHFDHIGWVTDQERPFFPNATYRCERKDVETFVDSAQVAESMFHFLWDAPPARDKLAGVLDRLEPFDGDLVISPGIDVRFAPGHTPGNTIVVLSSGAERAMLLGDAVHCPLELMDEDFSIMGDMDQALADRTREAIRREIEGVDVPVSSAHFPGLRFGRLLPGQGKRGWVFERAAS